MVESFDAAVAKNEEVLPDKLEELMDGQQIVDSIRDKIDQRRNEEQDDGEEETASTTLMTATASD